MTLLSGRPRRPTFRFLQLLKRSTERYPSRWPLDIEGLKQTGGKFVGTFATKADLDAYEIPDRIKANDFVYVIDDETHEGCHFKICLRRHGISVHPAGLATTTDAGLVLSGDGTHRRIH
jgi:hypothetical protein